MNCLKQSIGQTQKYAYAHHIQRLMVLGNFALLAGLAPKFVNEWYLIVYADAFEWVELPNVSGMVLFADGGYLASKPYKCWRRLHKSYVQLLPELPLQGGRKTGSDACPFNYLYWHFLIMNRDRLGNNARLGMIYRSLDRMSEEKQQTIMDDARQFLNSLA